jgi:hypothetical protein
LDKLWRSEPQLFDYRALKPGNWTKEVITSCLKRTFLQAVILRYP